MGVAVGKKPQRGSCWPRDHCFLPFLHCFQPFSSDNDVLRNIQGWRATVEVISLRKGWLSPSPHKSNHWLSLNSTSLLPTWRRDWAILNVFTDYNWPRWWHLGLLTVSNKRISNEAECGPIFLWKAHLCQHTKTKWNHNKRKVGHFNLELKKLSKVGSQ